MDFVFGMDASVVLKKRAEELPKETWKVLVRKPKHAVKTQEWQKPENIKEEIVKEKGYKNIRLESERVAEFEYQPGNESDGSNMHKCGLDISEKRSTRDADVEIVCSDFAMFREFQLKECCFPCKWSISPDERSKNMFLQEKTLQILFFMRLEG